MKNQNFFTRKQTFFDRWATNYDCLLTTVFYQAIHQRILDYITLNDGNYILDLGCGTGKLLKRLGEKFPTISAVGLDLSEQMITKATFNNQFPVRIKFKQGNAESLPFDNNTFDGVFNTISFLHYPNPQQVFNEISRILKKGGYFYLADFNYNDILNLGSFPFSPGGLKFYTRNQMENFGVNCDLIYQGNYYLLAGVVLNVFKKK